VEAQQECGWEEAQGENKQHPQYELARSGIRNTKESKGGKIKKVMGTKNEAYKGADKECKANDGHFSSACSVDRAIVIDMGAFLYTKRFLDVN
jgi:hypothetical protein